MKSSKELLLDIAPFNTTAAQTSIELMITLTTLETKITQLVLKTVVLTEIMNQS